MKVWCHRYVRDLQRLHLAQRFIAHKARTQVIADWTGLTRVQVRTLFREFGEVGKSGGIARHRGPGPTNVAQILRSERWRCEAAALIGICYVFEAMPPGPVRNLKREFHDVTRGERFCRSFEIYRALYPGRCLDFDQALLLYTAVAIGEEVKAAKCERCDAVIVRDAHGRNRWNCARCSGTEEVYPKVLNGSS